MVKIVELVITIFLVFNVVNCLPVDNKKQKKEESTEHHERGQNLEVSICDISSSMDESNNAIYN